MKAIGFNQGQYGDLVINLIACKAFKEKFPGSRLVFGINQKYESIKEIFLYNKLIDDIHVWESYNDWPSINDKKFINENEFNYVFNPMPLHSREDWYLYFHQTQEVCLMHGLEPPQILQAELNQYFNTERHNGYVAVNLFAETLADSPKIPNLDKAKDYCILLKKLGYKPVQIGLHSDPQICEDRFIGTFFDTIKFSLGCDFVFTVDSAISWIMSGYKHRVLGIYNYKYYRGATTSKTWQPINPNALYIESDNINIDNEIIASQVKYYDN